MRARVHGPGLLRASAGDLAVAAAVLAWIGLVLLADGVRALDAAETARQLTLGATTWLVLGALLRRETPLVRAQTLVVVALATCVEYTFSPLLEAYVYRIHTVPLFVPPGHGLVYLAALALGRTALMRAWRRPLVALTVLVGGAWAASGLLGLVDGRHDVLGAFWFACLLGIPRLGAEPRALRRRVRRRVVPRAGRDGAGHVGVGAVRPGAARDRAGQPAVGGGRRVRLVRPLRPAARAARATPGRARRSPPGSAGSRST